MYIQFALSKGYYMTVNIWCLVLPTTAITCTVNKEQNEYWTFLKPELAGPKVGSTTSGLEPKIQHSSDWPFNSQKHHSAYPLPSPPRNVVIAQVRASHKLVALGSLVFLPPKITFSSTCISLSVQNNVYLLEN